MWVGTASNAINSNEASSAKHQSSVPTAAKGPCYLLAGFFTSMKSPSCNTRNTNGKLNKIQAYYPLPQITGPRYVLKFIVTCLKQKDTYNESHLIEKNGLEPDLACISCVVLDKGLNL